MFRTQSCRRIATPHRLNFESFSYQKYGNALRSHQMWICVCCCCVCVSSLFAASLTHWTFGCRYGFLKNFNLVRFHWRKIHLDGWRSGYCCTFNTNVCLFVRSLMLDNSSSVVCYRVVRFLTSRPITECIIITISRWFAHSNINIALLRSVCGCFLWPYESEDTHLASPFLSLATQILK